MIYRGTPSNVWLIHMYQSFGKQVAEQLLELELFIFQEVRVERLSNIEYNQNGIILVEELNSPYAKECYGLTSVEQKRKSQKGPNGS